MDNYKVRLDKIISIKEVHDLNLIEKKEVIEILIKMISEEDENYIEYLIKFPPGVGIFAFVKKIKELDFQEQKQKIGDLFFKAKKINKFQVIKRGLSLIDMLLKEKIDEEVTWFAINKVLTIMEEFSGKKLKASIAEQFYKLLIKQSHEFLFKLNINSKFLSKIESKSLFNIFINTVFFRDKDLLIDPKFQFGVLNWFAKSDIEFKVNVVQGINLKHYIKKWPIEIIDKIKSKIEIIEKFKPFINDVLASFIDDNKYEFGNTVSTKNDDISAKENISFNNTKKQITDPFSELIMFSKSLNSAINRTRSKLGELEDFRDKCAGLENNIAKLKNETSTLNININSLIDEKNLLESKLKEHELQLTNKNKLIKDLESKNRSNQLIIENLHNSSELEKNNLLEDYKNKITFRLKAEYLDFISIRDKEINKDLANNLKTQLDNVFNELKRNGIKL